MSLGYFGFILCHAFYAFTGFGTWVLGLLHMIYGLWIMDYGLWVTDYSGYGPPMLLIGIDIGTGIGIGFFGVGVTTT